MLCTDEGGRLSCGLFRRGYTKDKRCVMIRKDGTRRHVLKNARVFYSATGGVLGGVETLTDITELVDKDQQIGDLRRELTRSYGYEGLVGTSSAMQELFAILDAAASSHAPVLLLGESGTGKELAAAAIHRRSSRSHGPFVKVSCAALAESVLESELFGHERGAFSGADRRRTGRFEAAHGGSLFLDEIGDLPPAVQVKLLRALQEGEIERVGSNETIEVDVRIICATNRDLTALMAAGTFRDDLYYRISALPIVLPPLRHHREDVPLLADTIIERAALRSGRTPLALSKEALTLLTEHSWPGNVRELINAMEYALVTCRGDAILARHLPPTIRGAGPGQENDEQAEIDRALEATGGNRTRAAGLLGVSRVTLWKRMKRLGLVRPTRRGARGSGVRASTPKRTPS